MTETHMDLMKEFPESSNPVQPVSKKKLNTNAQVQPIQEVPKVAEKAEEAVKPTNGDCEPVEEEKKDEESLPRAEETQESDEKGVEIAGENGLSDELHADAPPTVEETVIETEETEKSVANGPSVETDDSSVFTISVDEGMLTFVVDHQRFLYKNWKK